MNFKIRAARKEDCKDISRMIMELAVYEKMPEQVKISNEDLERDGFSPNPFFECLIAEVSDEYMNKDGKGIGKGLLAKVAQVAVAKRCVRLQFSVLEWNKPSLDFYFTKGAEDLTAKEGWHFLRFHGQALDQLAREAPNN
ncbi:diamine acetyltransferase 2b [Esox lucius]|uniref:Diamine acetyltransferase 2 n=1 Tax=Esox lucius TaxID=8010 RepID=C1BZR0_ESOLU|nr:diamine acetyltransferase 2b [Esox lucius]ACO14513.1 Diamine acetyltransferase 2 [Esox lucius]